MASSAVIESSSATTSTSTSDTSPETSKIDCVVEFSGGSELLFGGQKRIQLKVPSRMPNRGKADDPNGHAFTVRDLLSHLRTHHLTDRPELFVQGEDIRPGILIVINEVDSELCGHLDYELQSKDTVLFISTLHGG